MADTVADSRIDNSNTAAVQATNDDASASKLYARTHTFLLCWLITITIHNQFVFSLFFTASKLFQIFIFVAFGIMQFFQFDYCFSCEHDSVSRDIRYDLNIVYTP